MTYAPQQDSADKEAQLARPVPTVHPAYPVQPCHVHPPLAYAIPPPTSEGFAAYQPTTHTAPAAPTAATHPPVTHTVPTHSVAAVPDAPPATPADMDWMIQAFTAAATTAATAAAAAATAAATAAIAPEPTELPLPPAQIHVCVSTQFNKTDLQHATTSFAALVSLDHYKRRVTRDPSSGARVLRPDKALMNNTAFFALPKTADAPMASMGALTSGTCTAGKIIAKQSADEVRVVSTIVFGSAPEADVLISPVEDAKGASVIPPFACSFDRYDNGDIVVRAGAFYINEKGAFEAPDKVFQRAANGVSLTSIVPVEYIDGEAKFTVDAYGNLHSEGRKKGTRAVMRPRVILCIAGCAFTMLFPKDGAKFTRTEFTEEMAGLGRCQTVARALPTYEAGANSYVRIACPQVDLPAGVTEAYGCWRCGKITALTSMCTSCGGTAIVKLKFQPNICMRLEDSSVLYMTAGGYVFSEENMWMMRPLATISGFTVAGTFEVKVHTRCPFTRDVSEAKRLYGSEMNDGLCDMV